VKELKKANKKIGEQVDMVKEAEVAIRENRAKMKNMEEEMKAYQERYEKNEAEN
jgi:hypothetical protein